MPAAAHDALRVHISSKKDQCFCCINVTLRYMQKTKELLTRCTSKSVNKTSHGKKRAHWVDMISYCRSNSHWSGSIVPHIRSHTVCVDMFNTKIYCFMCNMTNVYEEFLKSNYQMTWKVPTSVWSVVAWLYEKEAMTKGLGSFSLVMSQKCNLLVQV